MHKVRKVVLSVTVVGLLAAGLLFALTSGRYRHDMRGLEDRLRAGSRVMATSFGDIEYASRGEGEPVLVVHGAGGGYDQGLILGEAALGTGLRLIVPSRFGYLRSSIPGDASPRAQANAYAALLDGLGIPEATVVAVSDGGPSALQFALRHPERCTALVMISAKSHTPPTETLLQKVTFNVIFRSDYLYWLVTESFEPFLLSMFGVPEEAQARLDPASERLIGEFLASMHPMSQRRAGIYNDRATLAVLAERDFALERITAPTLVVHAVDDGLQPYSHAEHTHRRVPGARLLSFPTGGHMVLVGHADGIRQRVRRLIQSGGGVPMPSRVDGGRR